MDKKEIIQLTNRIYRLTLLFPKKEPLRYKTRKKADEILEKIIGFNSFSKENALKSAVEKNAEIAVLSDLKKDLEVISAYFEIIKWQNWVSYFDALEFQDKYDKIKNNVGAEIEELSSQDFSREKTVPLWNNNLGIAKERPVAEVQEYIVKTPLEKKSLDERKDKIIEFLKEKEKIQVWEMSRMLPNVSKRTLRRDFVDLLKQGLIERIGEKNNTFYKIKVQSV